MHIFHTDCLAGWKDFQTNAREEHTCPLCRAPIDDLKTEQAVFKGREAAGAPGGGPDVFNAADAFGAASPPQKPGYEEKAPWEAEMVQAPGIVVG